MRRPNSALQRTRLRSPLSAVSLDRRMTRTSILHEAVAVCVRHLKRLGGDPRALPVRERTVIVITTAQGIIDNGGFQYFFESDFPRRPPYSVFIAAYRRIGALRAATCLERAVGMFPFARPHLSQHRRNQFMDSLPRKSRFFSLGFRVCGDDSVWSKLDRYIQANQQAFGLRSNPALQRTRSARR